MKTSEFQKLAVLLFVGLYCLSAKGQTFQVITTADSGPGSLRGAITNATAAGGGTIVFSNLSGTINLQSALPDISGTLSIVGNGQTNLAINGYRTNRIFNVLAGANCSISDLTLQGGPPLVQTIFPYLSGDKAVFNAGALSISNCFVRDCGSGDYAAGAGAAISSTGTSLVLNNVVLSNNAAHGWAAFSASNVRATNCLFINNRVGDTPPIAVGGDSVFSDTTFTENQAWFATGGGGISAGGNLTLLNCSVTNNFGDNDTGGIYFHGNSLTISNCVINNNYSDGSFGGINASATNILILNSTISGNRADSYSGMTLVGNTTMCGCTISSNVNEYSYFGGGVAASALNMTNCTITGNLARYDPSVGVFGGFGSIRAVNCTIAFNGVGVENSVNTSTTFYALNTIIANNGTGPTNGDFFGTLTSQGNNLIGNLNTNTIIVGSTNGDIYGLDPLLGPLRNNGSPTLTHALMKGSPAIDAGTTNGAPPIDQRGVARPYGKTVDIGAFESEYNVLRFTDVSRLNSTNIHLQVEGLPGSVCTIQASSNSLDWENVVASSNGLTGILEFVDQDAANHPNRFYRALIND